MQVDWLIILVILCVCLKWCSDNKKKETMVNTTVMKVSVNNNKFTIDGQEAPPLTLQQGTETYPKIYLFKLDEAKMGDHVFVLTKGDTDGGSYATEMTEKDGVLNNGVSKGTVSLKVTESTPQTFYYNCAKHKGMGSGIILI